MDGLRYLWSALLSPWSFLIASMGGFVALIDQAPEPLFVAVGAACALALVRSSTKGFRASVDARTSRRLELQERRRLERLLVELAPNQKDHYLELRKLTQQIQRNYERLSPAHSSLLLSQSRAKIDSLLGSFLRLLQTLNDYRRVLNETDRQLIEQDLAELSADLEAGGGAEAITDVKRRRIEILKKRLGRFEKAEESRELIAHQLASIEDMLRLIYEQSVTMRDPEAITQQLDLLSIEIEGTESTVRDMEQFLELTAEVRAFAPPMPDRVR